MRITTLSLISLIALLVSATVPALALETGWFSSTIPTTATDWVSGSLGVPFLNFAQFDGGTTYVLTRVDWDLTGAVSGMARYENLDNQPHAVSLSLSTVTTWYRPGGTTAFVVINSPLVSINETAGAYDGTTDYGGTSGNSVTNNNLAIGGSGFLVSGDTGFDAFKGSGTVSTSGQVSGNSSASGPAHWDAQFTSSAGITGRVKYTYEPDNRIPEPGTTGLFLAGLGAISVIRRRRRQA